MNIVFKQYPSQFQSTLLQEERQTEMVKAVRWIYFNPRSYKRSDSIRVKYLNLITISIHAPTRGATAKMHNIPYASLQ